MPLDLLKLKILEVDGMAKGGAAYRQWLAALLLAWPDIIKEIETLRVENEELDKTVRYLSSK